MSEHQDDDELASRLFAAARSEQPPASVRMRVMRAAARGPRRETSALPWLALAAAALCVLAVLSRRSTQSETAVVAAHDAIPMAASPSAAARPSAVKAETHAPTTEPAIEHPDRSSTKTPAVSLAQETAALDAVRAALARGDAADALGRLHRYEHTKGAERLRTEAMLLRVEALSADGQPAAAAVLARRFLQTYPSSPLADRVRTLAASDEEPRDEEARPSGDHP